MDEGVRAINTLCEKIINLNFVSGEHCFPRVLIYPNTFIQGQYVYIISVMILTYYVIYLYLIPFNMYIPLYVYYPYLFLRIVVVVHSFRYRFKDKKYKLDLSCVSTINQFLDCCISSWIVLFYIGILLIINQATRTKFGESI